MSAPEDIAGRLLDLQVSWAIGEVTGSRLAEVLARDVDDLLEIASRHTLGEVVDRDAVKVTAREIAAAAGDSVIIESLVADLAAGVHGLPAAADHTPGELVEREHVEALVAKLISMHRLHEQALARVAESPQVGVVATKFVTKIVADFLQQNRERAEKVPGMSSLFSLGSGAVNRVRSVTDPLLGDAGAKGAQFAIRRTNAALLELVRDAPLQEAAMEIWGLHADEPLAELRRYLTERDVRELAGLIHQLLAGAASTEYLGAVLDACIDVVFDSYGDQTVAEVLEAAGIGRDDLVDAVVRHASTLLGQLHASGDLEVLIRSRLAPFFGSADVLATIAGEAVTVPTGKVPKAAKGGKSGRDETAAKGEKATKGEKAARDEKPAKKPRPSPA